MDEINFKANHKNNILICFWIDAAIFTDYRRKRNFGGSQFERRLILIQNCVEASGAPFHFLHDDGVRVPRK